MLLYSMLANKSEELEIALLSAQTRAYNGFYFSMESQFNFDVHSVAEQGS